MTYQLSRWSLTDLFPSLDSPELESTFTELEARVADFEKLRPQLAANIPASSFMEIMKDFEGIADLSRRPLVFAGLSFSADTQDKNVLALLGRAQQVGAEIRNRMLFFNLWWKGLDDADANRLMEASGDYRYFLEDLRHFKPYTLSEGEEKIINLKDVTGASALVNVFNSITNRYTFTLEVEGEKKELTQGELAVYRRVADPELRAKAYQELFRVLSADSTILGQIYQAIARDWRNENINLRHFSSPISARNLGNDIPDEAVEALLKACERNASVFQRFFRLKAKHLNVPKLRRYDIYAPIASSERSFDFERAAGMVFESFTAFDPRFGELARRVLDTRHLDSEVRKGKEGGAFCASVSPEMVPWVLVNFQGKAEDVSTLAHELGHAIHSQLASDHSLFTFNASLPLAETASTFGEMMLLDRLLAEEKDPAVQRDMLFRQLDDAYATIGRQAYFAIFEKRAHELVAQNASVDQIAEAYLENLQAQFGDSLDLSEDFKWEWIGIPHFYHTPFYVYAYAFGQLLVFSLYQQYKAEGEAFKPRYIKILSAGGSEAPVKILADAGIDICSEAFWQGGFDVIAGLVDRLEKL